MWLDHTQTNRRKNGRWILCSQFLFSKPEIKVENVNTEEEESCWWRSCDVIRSSVAAQRLFNGVDCIYCLHESSYLSPTHELLRANNLHWYKAKRSTFLPAELVDPVKTFVVLITLKTEDLWILEHVTAADVTCRPLRNCTSVRKTYPFTQNKKVKYRPKQGH